MSGVDLPADVLAIVRSYRTAELATLARDGTPIVWPIVPFFDETRGVFLITTSVALDRKMRNARRDPHVSLFFSDPTGSGLPPGRAVLVKGLAEATDAMTTSVDGFEAFFEQVFRRQPAGTLYTRTAPTRWLFDWYYMRLVMTITPVRWYRVDTTTAGSQPELLEERPDAR